jgi:hypothetical protein
MIKHHDAVRAATAALLSCAVLTSPVPADTIVIGPSKDNTLIEPINPEELYSNALGSMYVGKVRGLGGNTLRRFVIAFDIAGALPAGSTIDSVSLALRIESTHGGSQTIVLRRALADWGEGTSFGLGAGSPATPGDATWLHTFYNTDLWTNAGGDFSSDISASLLVGSSITTDYIWSTPEMADDAQAWLDNPASNFGWLVRGNETTSGVAKGFFSREAPDVPFRPRLTINYTPPPPCPADIDGNGDVDADDLVAVILAWGCTNPPGPCPADADGSGTVDADDLTLVILAWGPCQ